MAANYLHGVEPLKLKPARVRFKAVNPPSSL
ncbi:Uncharacterised protein [Escherichia coli]|uniref:Uncharacterized protein n=1 Tax=Escherichia coli TaxID=562 RepID=A0A377B720_ECOLX|nr:Uncharacterised protein [Escherichia coli]